MRYNNVNENFILHMIIMSIGSTVPDFIFLFSFPSKKFEVYFVSIILILN